MEAGVPSTCSRGCLGWSRVVVASIRGREAAIGKRVASRPGRSGDYGRGGKTGNNDVVVVGDRCSVFCGARVRGTYEVRREGGVGRAQKCKALE